MRPVAARLIPSHLGSQPMVSVSHRMWWCSSLATRLTALMNRFRKEWKPPQCAILKSPCTPAEGESPHE